MAQQASETSFLDRPLCSLQEAKSYPDSFSQYRMLWVLTSARPRVNLPQLFSAFPAAVGLGIGRGVAHC